MSHVVWATVIGLLAGVLGTATGGLIVMLFRRPSDAAFSVILGFAGGVMLAVTAFDLMPEAFELAGTGWGIGGLVLGAILIALIDLVTPHIHFLSTDRESSRFVRASLFVGIGIAIHNLPEGMAIGAGVVSSQQFGIGLGVLLGLHNAPEGMAMSAPLCRVKGCGWRPVLMAALAGLPTGLGAAIGAIMGAASKIVLALCLGFAAGAMLFVTCDELIPDAQELGVGHSGTYGIVAGVVTGIVLSTVLGMH